MGFDIRQAGEEDLSSLYNLYDQMGKSDAGYFEACLKKECFILIAAKDKKDIGFGVLNFDPKYSLYQRLEIPEIQDLNVISEAREQGAATALLNAMESIARDQGADQIGISVGLTKDYGAAQRLYVKQGYVPDGYGVTYDRVGVVSGQKYVMDDDLALMLVKDL